MSIHRDGQFDGFDGFSFKKLGSAIKKSFSSPKAALQTIGKAVVAPIAVPTAIAIKGTTYALGKTGLKPLKKLDSAVGRVYRGDLTKSTRDIFAAELAVGAVVGAGVVAAPYVASAAGAAKGAAVTAGAAALKAGKEAVTEAAREKASELATTALQAGTQLVGAGVPPEEVAAMTPDQQVAAAQVLQTPTEDKSSLFPVVGGVLGFLVGGPIGAAAGVGAGLLIKKR